MSVQSVKKKMDFDKLVKERLVAANTPKPAEEKPVDPKLIKRRKYAAKWRANNREKVKEYSRQWRLKNPGKRKEVERKADAKRKNDPKRILWQSEYEEKRKHDPKRIEYKKKYQEENKERDKERKRRFRSTDFGKACIMEYNREYRLRKGEAEKARKRAWYHANKNKGKEKNEEKEDDHKTCPDQERKENSSRSQHADGEGRI